MAGPGELLSCPVTSCNAFHEFPGHAILIRIKGRQAVLFIVQGKRHFYKMLKEPFSEKIDPDRKQNVI